MLNRTKYLAATFFLGYRRLPANNNSLIKCSRKVLIFDSKIIRLNQFHQTLNLNVTLDSIVVN